MTQYVDWAVGQKFGVMDVNVPPYISQDDVSLRIGLSSVDVLLTVTQDMDAFIPGFKERALQEQIQSLICYLWDNFLQLSDADEIFLMGVGNAYLGVKVLLINRGK